MPDRWNQRYSQTTDLPTVSYCLTQYKHLLPQQGTGLDLACGLGQNSIFLAKHGLTMHSWDYSKAGLAQMAEHCLNQNIEVNQHCIDLANTPWPEQQFDMICVTAYLERALCPQIMGHLKPGGVLVYQTFNQFAEIAGKIINKPRRPQLLLAPAELLQLFSELEPLIYHDEQERADISHPLVGKALLIARKPQSS